MEKKIQVESTRDWQYNLDAFVVRLVLSGGFSKPGGDYSYDKQMRGMRVPRLHLIELDGSTDSMEDLFSRFIVKAKQKHAKSQKYEE